MARNVTLLSLRTQALQRADMQNSNFIDSTSGVTCEANNIINASAAELYDLLVTNFEDYYTSSSTISVVSGTDTYSLPASFYKLLGVDLVIDSNGNAVTLKRFSFSDRNAFLFTPTMSVVGLAYLRYMLQGQNIKFVPLPSSASTVKLWFIPTLTPLSADSDTFDGINGWEDYIIVDSAIRFLTKEESDTSSLAAEKASIIKRINDSAPNRDAGSSGRVSDINKAQGWEDWAFSQGGGN